MIKAVSLGDVSRVLVVIEAFLVAVLVLEHWWLKETSQVITKTSAVILAVLGAWLMIWF